MMKSLRAFGIGIFLAGAAFGVQNFVVDKHDDKPVKQQKVAANNDKLAAAQQQNEKLVVQVETLEKKLKAQQEKTKKATEQAKAAKEKAEKTATTKEQTAKTTAPATPTTTKPTTTPANGNYNLTITSAMGSTEISNQLQKAGVISNAREFEQYIISHNKATSLQNGTFHLKKGMSYDDILTQIAK